MPEPLVDVAHFTDPGCPFAFSAEPHRIKVLWNFGDQVRLRTRLIVLSDSPQELADRGFTTELMSTYYVQLQREHGMPITDQPFPRLHHTRPACELVAGVRRHAPDRADRVLREMRKVTMAGNLMDEPETLARAATASGLDAAAALAWAKEPETLAELEVDWRETRDPGPVSMGALRHKLSEWSGGMRYSAPSWIATAGGTRTELPGFISYDAYESALGNLAPQLEKRGAPTDATEALRWAEAQDIGALATVEVATLLGVGVEAAREALKASDAQLEVAGLDGYWSLAS